jgi:membrane-associated phospholipid phosphatase
MYWMLPHVHPEPFECTWYHLDLWLFGRDVTAPLFAAAETLWLPLQLVYAAFYLLPIAAALLVLLDRGVAAFDRAVAILVGSFLVSYFLYLWFPTLAPKVVLPGQGSSGGAVFDFVRHSIDTLEANVWDCFPSGHTMLSLTSVLVVWRWARRWLPLVLAIALPLIASTVVLRYHWPVDVVAGALLCWPVARLCDVLLAGDGVDALDVEAVRPAGRSSMP